MKRQVINTLGVCSTLIFSGSLAYAANDISNNYVDPTARVEALVNAINY